MNTIRLTSIYLLSFFIFFLCSGHFHSSLITLSSISVTPVGFLTQSILFLFLIVKAFSVPRYATNNFNSCLFVIAQFSQPYVITGRINWLKTYLLRLNGKFPFNTSVCFQNAFHHDNNLLFNIHPLNCSCYFSMINIFLHYFYIIYFNFLFPA